MIRTVLDSMGRRAVPVIRFFIVIDEVSKLLIGAVLGSMGRRGVPAISFFRVMDGMSKLLIGTGAGLHAESWMILTIRDCPPSTKTRHLRSLFTTDKSPLNKKEIKTNCS